MDLVPGKGAVQKLAEHQLDPAALVADAHVQVAGTRVIHSAVGCKVTHMMRMRLVTRSEQLIRALFRHLRC